MARLLLLSIVLLIGPVCLSLPTLAAAQPSDTPSRYRVAVVDFSVTDLTGTVSDPESVGRAMAIAFQTPLVQSRRFTVLTRQQLDAVLSELALAQSGIIDPAEARQMGTLSGADLLITGSIVFYGAEQLRVTANFIDVASGAIVAAPTFSGAGPQDFARLAEQFVREALFEFPARGRMLRVDDERAYINLGSNGGLSDAALTGTVYRDVDLGETTFQEMIGAVEVVQVSPDASLVTVLSGAPQAGDLVVMVPPESLGGTTENANDRGVDLVVRGEPVGARLYLDDMFVGRLAEGVYQGNIPAETVQLRVEAEGYQTLTRGLEPTPPRTEVQIRLEPLTVPRLGFLSSLLSVVGLLGAVIALHIFQYRTRFATLGLHKHRPPGSTNHTYSV